MEAARLRQEVSPARTGVWVGIGAITMSFGAYTSALVFREGGTTHLQLPPLLYLNTLVLLASSATLAIGARRVRWGWLAQASGGADVHPGAPEGLAWLYATAGLGVLFLAGQLRAWQELAGQGLFLATNPASSFFYVLTALHAVHLAGGLAGLAYLLHRVRREPAGAAGGALGAVSLYWHFMDVLWIYLLLLLIVRL
jgi:cytochrome c oxidase subunit 3